MNFFSDNSENTENTDVLTQVRTRISVLEVIYGPDLLKMSMEDVFRYVYGNLVNLLAYAENRIYSQYLLFIKQIYEDQASFCMGSSRDSIPELVILYYVIRRLFELGESSGTSFYDCAIRLYQNVGECCVYLPEPDHSGANYKLLCVNGRVVRYLDIFTGVDNHPTLREFLTDEAEVRCYIFQKIHHTFMKELQKFPDYYFAYTDAKKVAPPDYGSVITSIIRRVVCSLGNEIPHDIDPDSLISCII